jgi:hypothetical protein
LLFFTQLQSLRLVLHVCCLKLLGLFVAVFSRACQLGTNRFLFSLAKKLALRHCSTLSRTLTINRETSFIRVVTWVCVVPSSPSSLLISTWARCSCSFCSLFEVWEKCQPRTGNTSQRKFFLTLSLTLIGLLRACCVLTDDCCDTGVPARVLLLLLPLIEV